MISGQFFGIILLLILEFCGKECSGSVQCYICVWMTSPEGHSPEVDNCRSGKLDPTTVVSDSCLHGCYLTIIHEYEPERNLTRQIAQSSNCTTDTATLSKSNMTMTLFARKCSEKPVTRDHCHIATMAGFRSEERFCNTNYCNGEGTGSSMFSHRSQSILFLSIILLIQNLRALSSSVDYQNGQGHLSFTNGLNLGPLSSH